MSDRRARALQRPDPDASYARFPEHVVPAGGRWYRAHTDRRAAPDRGAWWFASSPETAAAPGSGRFDLPPPRGTCYLASTAPAAADELIGPDIAARGWVDASLVDGRVVSRLAPTSSARVANVSVARAARFRVTAELTATGDYDLTQAWARTFDGTGYDGIRYALRFSPGAARGLALFGSAGSPDPPWPGDPYPEPLADRLATMGVDVVPIPRSTAITVVDPPA